MLSFRQYRGLANNDAAPEAASSIIEAQSGIESQIDKLVDDWMAELKAELIQGTFVTGQRSMWDRFKNTIANLWHGRQSIDNPYLWQNKLGYDLGRKVESVTNIHMPLHHYKYLYESFSVFAEQINEAAVLPPGTANLRIMQVLDKHATMLKRRLKELFATAPEKAPAAPPAASAPEKAPAAPPAAPAPATSAPSSSSATASNPPAADKDEYHFENLPPDENRDWNSLTQAEKDLWNKLGGGISSRQGSRGGVGVEMPYILRLGDPRHRNLAAAEAGIQNHYKARRVEKAENPIKSKQELDERVKKVVDKKRGRTQPTAQSGPSTGTGGSGAPRQRPQQVQDAPAASKTSIENPEISLSSAEAPAASRPSEAPVSGVADDEPAISTGSSTSQRETESQASTGQERNTEKEVRSFESDDEIYRSFYHIWEWWTERASNEEQANELASLLTNFPSTLEEFRSKVREFAEFQIGEMVRPEKRPKAKEELNKADTDEKLYEFIYKLLHDKFNL